MTIRVFLADDHAVLRDGLGLLLEAEGDMSVVGVAADGQEAVRKVLQLQPDVVIMDISMPMLSGIDATRQIRAHCRTIQVVILSMYTATEHIIQSLQAGARGYVLKESAGAEVVSAVRVAHAGQRYLSQKIADAFIDGYIQGHQLPNPLESLSGREREVLQLLVEGKSNPQIAAILSLSPKSVETYRSRLMQKLGISDIPHLVRFAIQHGLIPLE
jgi:DNA-binding NarL/FixJ family response regulator